MSGQNLLHNIFGHGSSHRKREVSNAHATTLGARQSGQILLIAILLSTVLLTVGLSLIDITSQDTQQSKTQEEASRARAAAEAGIEAALNNPAATEVDIATLLGEGYSGDVVITQEETAEFETPLISKDGQYSFYLTGYDPASATVVTAVVEDNMIIDRITPSAEGYCDGDQAFALELTFLSATSGVVQRYMIDECSLLTSTTGTYAFGAEIPVSSIAPTPEIMTARVIAPNNNFDGAKIMIQNTTPGAEWPAQGRTITSTASVGTSGVTKKVRLFQSYPQFPAEFFVTQM